MVSSFSSWLHLVYDDESSMPHHNKIIMFFSFLLFFYFGIRGRPPSHLNNIRHLWVASLSCNFNQSPFLSTEAVTHLVVQILVPALNNQWSGAFHLFNFSFPCAFALTCIHEIQFLFHGPFAAGQHLGVFCLTLHFLCNKPQQLEFHKLLPMQQNRNLYLLISQSNHFLQ